MTTIFSDGQVGSTMETAGDFSAWTVQTFLGSVTFTVVTSPFHHGANSALVNGISGDSSASMRKTITATAGPVYFRQYVYLNALPASGKTWRLMGMYCGSYANLQSGYASLRNNSGTYQWVLAYRNGGSWSYQYVTASVSTGVWICLELQLTVGSGTGSQQFWVDGTSIASVGSLNNADRGSTILGVVTPSVDTDDTTFSINTDCFVVADSYIGPEGSVTVQTVADTLALNEGVLRNKLLSIADLVGLQDTQTRNKNLSLFENVEISDFVQALKTLAVTENFSLTDTLFTPSRIIQITEEVSLAEVAFTGEGGVKKTRLFLILGEVALQLTGD